MTKRDSSITATRRACCSRGMYAFIKDDGPRCWNRDGGICFTVTIPRCVLSLLSEGFAVAQISILSPRANHFNYDRPTWSKRLVELSLAVDRMGPNDLGEIAFDFGEKGRWICRPGGGSRGDAGVHDSLWNRQTSCLVRTVSRSRP